MDVPNLQLTMLGEHARRMCLLSVLATGCGSDRTIVDRSTLEVSPVSAKGTTICKVPMVPGPAVEVQIDGLKQLALEEICDLVRGMGATLEPGIRYEDSPRERTFWDIESALTKMYRWRGYLRVRLQVDLQANRIRIEEGARHQILSFTVENDPGDVDTDRHLKLLSRNTPSFETMVGTWFSGRAFYGAIESLQERLRREGYGYAEVYPRTELEGRGVHIALLVHRGKRTVSSPQKPVCGNGLVEPPETCDTAIESGRQGTCNIECSSQDPCVLAMLVTDQACKVSCIRTTRDCDSAE